MRYFIAVAQLVIAASLIGAPSPETVYIHNKDIAATKVVFRRGQKPMLEIWLTAAKSAEIKRAMKRNLNVATPLIDVLTSSGGSPSDHTELPVMYMTLDDLTATLKLAQDLTKCTRAPELRGIHFDDR